MKITKELIKAHNISDEEYSSLLKVLGREPSLTELGIISAIWSEHCSYKSTRRWLRELHTKEDFVIAGPGENAGIIDIGDGDALVFKMESHNHPSFIEPYQGAATGVGGILRDVFTMGARPIALLNLLRFGEVSNPKTKYLVSGVVSGIGGYGNCVGVPTVGGETDFHKSFNENNLVNAMCIGLAKKDKIFYSAASKVGASVVYVGSKTGKDGINGAVMASQEFNEDSESKKPTIQVGDPFIGKLLIEACLELMEKNCIIAIQDMGAAGLTSSSIEMTTKGGTGIELNLDLVPQREANMNPYEIMLSESQERMLIIMENGKESIAQEIFDKWELECAVIGKITDSGRLVIKMSDKIHADIDLAKLEEMTPIYEREWEYVKDESEIDFKDLTNQRYGL